MSQFFFLLASISFFSIPQDNPQATGLTAALIREGSQSLATAAREQGDPKRGAVVFYKPALACTTCHAVGGQGGQVGPELTAPADGLTAERIVESILEPSSRIREGYESATVATTDGQLITGRLIARSEKEITLADPQRPGGTLAIAATDIDEFKVGGPSIMPLGLANALSDRRQFLDLASYLIAINEGGPSRAEELRPSAAELQPRLPAYELDLDHAGLIRGLDNASLERGAAVYSRVCVNCHGTPDQAGSLPTSLKFWEQPLKNGADPFRMYQTLTHGYGQMPNQNWLVPRQKYDVIHYVRETYLKQSRFRQYSAPDETYLASLPKGKEAGPEPASVDPWVAMDYGPTISATIQMGSDDSNFAFKAIAVRLDPGAGGISRGHLWGMYDHDTMRLAGVWTGPNFIDWNCIHFNGSHGTHPKTVGTKIADNPVGPGWANPATGTFDDPRILGRDGKPTGPLPRDWTHFLGRYQNGSRMVMAYTVGNTRILDSLSLEENSTTAIDWEKPGLFVIRRTLNIGPSKQPLKMRVAKITGQPKIELLGVTTAKLSTEGDFTVLEIPASSTPTRLAIRMSTGEGATVPDPTPSQPENLEALLPGGLPLFPEPVSTPILSGGASSPFAVDEYTVPETNPWLALVRPTGFDFLEGGQRLAVSTWDGDVWTVDGITGQSGSVIWKRIASGLFQPLGVKIISGQIYVTCRDQIVILRDLNGDGYTDFYENFNNDHQVTAHFHEFAMGLQVDDQGQLYYSKAACHGLKATVPHHGTVLRVSADGTKTDIMAGGFRAPNGVCLNPDGTFMVTDQEGFWLPKNRINWVKPGSFHGNIWGYTDVTDTSDSAMAPPICWITNNFDRSPAEPLWVTSDVWKPLKGTLLNFSYGYGKIFAVPHEKLGDVMQGGMVNLPIPQLPTGLIRGRFSPSDGQLYTCGMFAWAGNQTKAGGLYRVRYTGGPVDVPVEVKARPGSLTLNFSDPLDPTTATDVSRYHFTVWSLQRSQKYGSDHIDEHSVEIKSARVSADGKTLTLEIPEIAPTWCYELGYDIKDASGAPVSHKLDGTINQLGP